MPIAYKGKDKGRETRQPRSRNTTPSSELSLEATIALPARARYIENDVSNFILPSSGQYSEILDRTGGVGPIPDSKSLESLVDQLKSLSRLAEDRGDACNVGIRELSQKRKEVVEEPTRIKREAEDDEESSRASNGRKLKKRRDRAAAEERPLSHGSHEVARQDGTDPKVEGGKLPCSVWLARKDQTNSFLLATAAAFSPSSANLRKRSPEEDSTLSSPSLLSIGAAGDVPPPVASLSPDDSISSHQPEPAPTVPQLQVFGPDPLRFEDPTIYHIRHASPEMTDEEKKAIYCVARFPASDLRHLLAGTPPDKDFSNAKPTNQVSANTFLGYIDPFVRPLTEEDVAFLKEKVGALLVSLLPWTCRLIHFRAIVRHRSLCLEGERRAIQTYGRKRMDRRVLGDKTVIMMVFH